MADVAFASAPAAAPAAASFITLVSKNNDQFEIRQDVACLSSTIKNMVDDVGELTPVPLPLVSSSTLSKVIEYMRFHFDNPTENDATSAWDARFIEVEYPIMYDLIIAANYLDIKSLLDLGCKRIASIVRGKTPDEIRAEFNIVNDLTPEEQAQIVKENTWVADN